MQIKDWHVSHRIFTPIQPRISIQFLMCTFDKLKVTAALSVPVYTSISLPHILENSTGSDSLSSDVTPRVVRGLGITSFE